MILGYFVQSAKPVGITPVLTPSISIQCAQLASKVRVQGFRSVRTQVSYTPGLVAWKAGDSSLARIILLLGSLPLYRLPSLYRLRLYSQPPIPQVRARSVERGTEEGA